MYQPKHVVFIVHYWNHPHSPQFEAESGQLVDGQSMTRNKRLLTETKEECGSRLHNQCRPRAINKKNTNGGYIGRGVSRLMPQSWGFIASNPPLVVPIDCFWGPCQQPLGSMLTAARVNLDCLWGPYRQSLGPMFMCEELLQ